jgi:hypothetical protein
VQAIATVNFENFKGKIARARNREQILQSAANVV